MAVIFDGLQNLTGRVLPNVKIENVQLSVGLDPEPETNPHINSSREYVAIGTSGNKLIQNSSTNITSKQIQNKNLFVDITLSILNVQNFNSSLILNQVNYLDFVYVKVIQSLSRELSRELMQGNFPIDYTKLKNTSAYTEKIFSLKDFYENKTLSIEVDDTNEKVFKHVKNVRFTSKDPNKSHLDIFAFCYVDLDQLIAKFEMNLGSNYEIKGNISKESVIADRKTSNKSYVLTDQNNNLFIGTPIKGVNGKFYSTKPTSPSQESVLQPLNVVGITNKKIVDLRDITSLQFENFTNTPLPSSLTSINTNLAVQQRNYSSDLYLSRQKDFSYSGFFAFDIISYLKSNSNNAKIYDDPNCLQYIRIKKLNLIRKRVKTIDNVVFPFNEYTPNKTIISTSEQSFGNLVNKISFFDPYNNINTISTDELNTTSNPPDTTRKVATITEIIVPAAANFRVFTFTDYEISKLTTGEYVYEINIDIEDRTLELVTTKLDILNNAKTKATTYFAEAERSDMFSVIDNRQTNTFVLSQKNKYNSLNLNNAINAGFVNQNINIQDAPWIYIPSSIVAMENDLLSRDNTDKVSDIYNKLNPSTTNPTKINEIIKYIDNLITETSDRYSIEQKQNKNVNSYKSNTIKVLNFVKNFNNVIDSDLKKIGIDFLNVPNLNNNSISFGIAKIKKSDFDTRTTSEIQKYFPSTTDLNLNDLNNDFNTDDVGSLADITTYSTCYLSPSSVMVDNKKEISLTTTNSSSLNLTEYDTIVNTSILSTSTKNKSISNQLLTSTNLSLSTVKNFSSNLSTNVQLSFIDKASLLVNSENSFNNSAFFNADRTFNLNDVCALSNIETKNEESLSNLMPLTNLILDDVIRPSSAEDEFNNVKSISTIDKFDIRSSTSFVSSLKQKKQLPPQNFVSNVSNNTNRQRNTISISSGITQPKINVKQQENALTSVPLQIKSLMLGNVTDTKFKLNSFDFDPFLHPSTKNFMRLNFQTICQIEYLAGFQDGDITKPIWKLLTKEDYDQLKGLVIVRTNKYDNNLLNIGTEKGFDYDIYNEFSIIEKEQITPTAIPQTTNNILPNVNVVVNNRVINTNNILSNLNINLFNRQQTQIARELIVLNTVDIEIKPEYTFSNLEIHNVV